MRLSVGPSLTKPQERQRAATYEAARILQEAGVPCKVVDLVAGPSFPKADSAMIVLTETGNVG